MGLSLCKTPCRELRIALLEKSEAELMSMPNTVTWPFTSSSNVLAAPMPAYPAPMTTTLKGMLASSTGYKQAPTTANRADIYTTSSYKCHDIK
jgi:hypothetical protein